MSPKTSSTTIVSCQYNVALVPRAQSPRKSLERVPGGMSNAPNFQMLKLSLGPNEGVSYIKLMNTLST